MIASLLADGIGIGAEGVAAVVIKALAVGGGFLVGYFLGGVIAWALDRWVFAHKAPAQLKRVVSLLTGIAFAILVALIVFGEGGKGLFGGGGQGEGRGTPKSEDKGKTEPTPTVTPKKEIIQPKQVEPTPSPKPADAIIRVTILGGRDVPGDERFYLIDDDPNPKTFPELKQIVLERKQNVKGAVAISIHYRAKEAPSRNPQHYSITQLIQWAQETAKVDVTLPAQR